MNKSKSLFPKKLKKGDKIRIIAPSRSLGVVSEEVRENAISRLGGLGLEVTFSAHSLERDELNSSSIDSRVSDINEAFADKNVDAVFSAIGGYGANQIVKSIDYEAVKRNPKIFCGFSDATIPSNAIYTKTGVVAYYGPHFSTFGMEKGLEYTIEYFKKCTMDLRPFKVEPSAEWSDDPWFEDQEKRTFIKNKGYLTIHPGEAEGPTIGGHLESFNQLAGTEYSPDMNGCVLFIEVAANAVPQIFERQLQSLMLRPDFEGVKALLIGRFQKESKMSNELLSKIIKSKKELDRIPVMANLDFGHTTPIATLPIGGRVRIECGESNKIEVLEH